MSQDRPLTKDQARVIVAPLYEALNEPAKKDVRALLAQATHPDYRSCSTLTDCLDRESLARVFEMMGKMIPDLRWTIQDVWVTEDKIVVLGLLGITLSPCCPYQPRRSVSPHQSLRRSMLPSPDK
jgi:hypothetical protein